MAISPLAIRIFVAGDRDAQARILATAATMSEVKKSTSGTNREMGQTAGSAQQVVLAARGISSEMRTVESRTARAADRAHELGQRFKEGAQHARDLVGHLTNAYSLISSLASKKWGSAFLDIVPSRVKRAAGMGMIGGGVALALGLGTTIDPAMSKEERLTAIQALVRDKGIGSAIYKQTDQLSTSSVFNLPELVVAAKTLTKDRQFSGRNLKAVDDLAAAARDEGATPADVARALGYIRSGRTGEGFESLSRFGVSTLDLRAKGLKFDAAGALDDKSAAGIQKAVDAVVSVIEERFGGLSEKLATETLSGAVSNLSDAFGRAKTVIGEEFIPVLNFGARTITSLVTWFANLPEPIHKVIAWGGLFTVGLLVIGGTLLIVGGTIAKLMLGWKILNFALGLFGTSIGSLAKALLTQMVPAMWTTMGVIGLIAVIAGATYVAVKGMADASSQSAAELEAHWGALGKFWTWASDVLTAIWNHPLFAWMHGGNGSVADDTLRLTENQKRKARGLKEYTPEEWKRMQADGDTTVDEVRKRDGAAGTNAELDRLKKQQDAALAGLITKKSAVSLTTGDAGMPVYMTGPQAVAMTGGGSGFAIGTGGGTGGLGGFGGMVGPGAADAATVKAAQAKVAAAEARVRSMRGSGSKAYSDEQIWQLEDAVRAARADGDKQLAERLRGQLETMRRANTTQSTASQLQKQAAQDELTAARKELSAAERAAKVAERKSDRAAKLAAEESQVGIEEDYETRIEALEAEKGALKGKHATERVRALSYQIAVLNAQKQRDAELARIAGMDDDDPAAKASARRIAERRYSGAMERAAIARDAAANGLKSLTGGVLPGVNAETLTHFGGSDDSPAGGGGPMAPAARETGRTQHRNGDETIHLEVLVRRGVSPKTVNNFGAVKPR